MARKLVSFIFIATLTTSSLAYAVEKTTAGVAGSNPRPQGVGGSNPRPQTATPIAAPETTDLITALRLLLGF